MKKILLLWLLLVSVGLTLLGCDRGHAVKGKVDLKGVITQVDYDNKRILMEDKKEGLVWVTLHENGDISKYEEGQEIVVWIKGGIKESSPAQADAQNIEFTAPKNE
ncbi:DUF3221 domain-containing protein [Neobacillus rhizosphaerae]|uniref:DUF3221 domain-containing protein n=1 Tax=Neobacillus rhizosphaerae TaxID=2880965 RepID=UPI003D28BB57